MLRYVESYLFNTVTTVTTLKDGKMNNSNIQKTIIKLRKQLQQANYAYHVLNESIMEDSVYDQLYRRLYTLEQENPNFSNSNSVTQRVGEKPALHFTSVKHNITLYSLENAFNLDELEAWKSRCQKYLGLQTNESIEYVTELKIDGSAISLTYKNGLLVRGLTRGDGVTGEDITQNIRTIFSIPLRLNLDNPPDTLNINGEVFLPFDEFTRINEQKKKEGKILFANPRNAAAGTLRQLDSKIVSKRRLQFFAYSLYADNLNIENQWNSLKFLQKCGFLVNPYYRLCKSLETVTNYFNEWKSAKKHLPYMTDGIVVKINSYSLQHKLGFTQRFPRWAIALKYPAEEISTIIIDIIFNTGRTGAVTPMAVMKPVLLGGTVVRKATLHNIERISQLGICIGDTVVVRKAGEIIPEVVRVLKTLRPFKIKTFQIPERCTRCNHILTSLSNEVVIRCINNSCPAILKGTLVHWASRDALDICGLGEKIIDLLISTNLVNSISDLYYLDFQKVSSLERMGKKSAENLIKSIERSKDKSWTQILYGLGIHHIGYTTAMLLTENFSSVKHLSKASHDSLMTIKGIGKEAAQSIVDWFLIEENGKLINKLNNIGFVLENKNSGLDESKLSKHQFLNMTFVITGSLNTLKRNEAKDLIKELGGKVVNSVTKKTNYIIVGNNPGSKLSEGAKLNIIQLNEAEFLKILKDTNIKNDKIHKNQEYIK